MQAPPAAFERARWNDALTLARYRKNERYLKKYSAFEVLFID